MRAVLLKFVFLTVISAVLSSVVPATAAEETENCKIADFLSPLPKVDVAAAKAFVSNVTYRSFSWGHGNQIEHATADGRVFLWYPGNRVILPGKWKLLEVKIDTGFCIRKRLKLCFLYGANTYNPVTGTRGAQWECGEYANFHDTRVEVVPGDPLGLAKMKVPPFPLPRDSQSIAQVQAQLPH